MAKPGGQISPAWNGKGEMTEVGHMGARFRKRNTNRLRSQGVRRWAAGAITAAGGTFAQLLGTGQ